MIEPRFQDAAHMQIIIVYLLQNHFLCATADRQRQLDKRFLPRMRGQRLVGVLWMSIL